MKRDWDYVTFEDYSSDMYELAGKAEGIIEMLKKERDDAIKMLAAVIGVVGEVRVPRDAFIHDLVIEKSTELETKDFILRAVNQK